MKDTTTSADESATESGVLNRRRVLKGAAAGALALAGVAGTASAGDCCCPETMCCQSVFTPEGWECVGYCTLCTCGDYSC